MQAHAHFFLIFLKNANFSCIFEKFVVSLQPQTMSNHLPDNWQAPDGIELHTDGELGFEWHEEDHWYVHPTDDYDGYAQNPISVGQWEKLELAGAVFLPAAGSSLAMAGNWGQYWSNASYMESKAYMFQFFYDEIDLSPLWDQPVSKINYIPIRPVREIK